MTVKTSISLTDQQYAYLKSVVDEGRAATISAVVQQAVEAHRRKEMAELTEEEALRELFRQRSSGPTVSVEEMRERFRRRRLELEERDLAG